MTNKNRVTGIDNRFDSDGDNIIEITCTDATKIDVAIDLAAAQVLVEILQKRLVLWAHQYVKNLALPQIDVVQVDLAHQGRDAQLMVTTDQIGTLVLRMSDDNLRKARREIDRALSYRSPTSSAH